MVQPRTYGQRLASKISIVTGAGLDNTVGEGIGSAIALLFAAEGAAVCCVDLDLRRAEAAVERIEAAGGRAVAAAGDVSEAADCARLIDTADAEFGGVDILINNVGISSPVNLATADEAAWQRVFDVNVKSAMLMSKFALPKMIARGGGSIVNISSIAGVRAQGALAYGPSKAAMAQLAREIAVMHGRQGIRANTVAPAHLATPFVLGLLPPEAREQRRKVSPLGIEGGAWDVAMAALFLASDEARFITGVQLPVDGGVTEIGAMPAHALLMAD